MWGKAVISESAGEEASGRNLNTLSIAAVTLKQTW